MTWIWIISNLVKILTILPPIDLRFWIGDWEAVPFLSRLCPPSIEMISILQIKMIRTTWFTRVALNRVGNRCQPLYFSVEFHRPILSPTISRVPIKWVRGTISYTSACVSEIRYQELLELALNLDQGPANPHILLLLPLPSFCPRGVGWDNKKEVHRFLHSAGTRIQESVELSKYQRPKWLVQLLLRLRWMARLDLAAELSPPFSGVGRSLPCGFVSLRFLFDFLETLVARSWCADDLAMRARVNWGRRFGGKGWWGFRTLKVLRLFQPICGFQGLQFEPLPVH